VSGFPDICVIKIILILMPRLNSNKTLPVGNEIQIGGGEGTMLGGSTDPSGSGTISPSGSIETYSYGNSLFKRKSKNTKDKRGHYSHFDAVIEDCFPEFSTR
jgi:hypothetical protein